MVLHQAFVRVPFYDDRRFDLPVEQVREIKREYIEQARDLADTLGLGTARSSREAMEASPILDLGASASTPATDMRRDPGPEREL